MSLHNLVVGACKVKSFWLFLGEKSHAFSVHTLDLWGISTLLHAKPNSKKIKKKKEKDIKREIKI